jgi:hypothetical protein
MRTLKAPASLLLLLGSAAFVLTGCKPGSPTTPAEVAASPSASEASSEAQTIAEAALGAQAEIVAHGDLALNGSEQLVAVNRLEQSLGRSDDTMDPAGMLITRAVVVQKKNGKWTEILRCDEHLKNPTGYLGRSPAGRVTAWRLKLKTDTRTGLELRFTPAESGQGRPSSDEEVPSRTIVVRWNSIAKRFQAFDQSHNEYQVEILSLETPESILKR